MAGKQSWAGVRHFQQIDKYRSNKKFQEDDENRVAIRRYEGNRGDLTIDY